MNNMNDNRSYSGLVEKYIGTAYDTVKLVADAIMKGWLSPDNMQTVDTHDAFLDSAETPLDKSKPYFTRGLLHKNDGKSGYYIYLDDQSRSLANGDECIDPSVPMNVQGQGAGVGIWVRQSWAAGIQGIPGPSGPEGPQGPHGGQGADGTDGVDGNPGTPGIQGDPGDPGRPGDPGSVGLPGPVGGDGSDGRDGTHGDNGHDGRDGSDGSDGRDGHDGVNGQPGVPGPIGPAGPGIDVKGQDTLPNIIAKTGHPGDMWISSTAGTHEGDTVEIGDGIFFDGTAWHWAGPIQGPAGASGLTGSTGPAGSDGIDGHDGTDGSDGADGVKGDPGSTGPRGPQGIQGAGIHLMGAVADASVLLTYTGMSDGDAYIASDTGFIWLYDADLTRMGFRNLHLINSEKAMNDHHWYDVGHVQGPQGNPGAPGSNGTDGRPGATGPRGPGGADGKNGSNGSTGPRGPAGPTAVSGTAKNLAAIDATGKIYVKSRVFKGTGNPPSSGAQDNDLFVKYTA